MTKKAERPRAGARSEVQKERFGAYFSRVFAFALCNTGDENAASEASVIAFSDTFALPDMREDEFEVALFRVARQHAAGLGSRKVLRSDGLTTREREVISLIFDAQLDRSQTGRVLGIREETVVATLLRGLRKIRIDNATSGAGAAVPSYS